MRERHLEAADRQHMPSLLNVVAGVWLILSPFVLGYSTDAAARNVDIVVGVVVAVLAAGRAFGHTGAWAAWTNVVLGAWVLVEPYMLRFGNHGITSTNHMVTGLIIVAFALWGAFALPMNERGGVATFAATEPTDEDLAERDRFMADRATYDVPPADDLPRP